MAKLITNVPDEVWERIDDLKTQVIEVEQIETVTKEQVVDAISRVCKRMGVPTPEVRIAPSPMAAVEAFMAAKGVSKSEAKQCVLNGMWHRCSAAWYRGARMIGVEFDEEIYQDYCDFTRAVPYLVIDEDLAVVSSNPVEIRWEGTDLHCEDGPSVRWADGFALWSLNGLPVDEQIVMRPETQTIDQIQGETNADIQTLRIDRYGWARYLKEINAEILGAT